MIKGIIFIDKTELFLYEEGITSVYQLSFPKEIVKDLDILNKDGFDVQFISLLETNKVLPARFTIVLSDNLLFTKDVQNPTAMYKQSVELLPPPTLAADNTVTSAKKPDDNTSPLPSTSVLPKQLGKPVIISEEEQSKLNIEVQTFLDSVPFENVGSKMIHLPSGTKVIATNSDLYEFLKRILEKRGSSIDCVVPLSLLHGITFASGLTLEVSRQILQQADIARQNGLLVNQQIIQDDIVEDEKKKR